MNNGNLITFAKAHGSGNDTILFIKENCPEIITDSNFIKKICQRRTGIGSDCVIVLSKDSKYDFKMDYYNSDGSWETFCANGARCAVKYLNQKKIIGRSSTFISGDGIHRAKVEKDKISIKMQTPKIKSEELIIENFKGEIIDSGAMHFCIKVDNIKQLDDIEKIGRTIRDSEIFMPKGINVNFFEINKSKFLKVMTYEKGVERLMLSCGSGSVASAFSFFKKNKIKSPIQTISNGGKLLISFNEDWSDVWIKGDAKILFESDLNINDI